MATFSLAEIKAKLEAIYKSEEKGTLKIKKLVINNLTVQVNPRADFVPYHKDIINYQIEEFLKDRGYFSREDIAPEISELVFPKQEYEQILTKIKDYIPEHDYGALLYAARICKAEEEGKPDGDIEILRDNLYKAYHNRGYTMYNWLRCGDVFNNDIFPFLDTLESKKEVNVKETFILMWESLIKFHYLRIFVSKAMLEDDLIDQILRRCLILKISVIHIYTRRTRNMFANRTINKLLKTDLKNYKLSIKEYKIGNSDARRFTLSIS